MFLIDGTERHKYSELLEKINACKSYCPFFQTKSIYEYFCNMIVALLSDKPLVLLDMDLNVDEIYGIDFLKINVLDPIENRKYNTIDDIIAKLLMSKSQITIFTSGTTGQPKKVEHSIQALTRFVRSDEKYRNQIWAYAYNPTHMAGLQVFFQAFYNQNLLINVFNKSRSYVYESVDKYQITHISATPTFYRLLLPIEKMYPSVKRVTLGGEKSEQKLYDSLLKIFPNAKINNIYASTEAGSLFVAHGEYFKIPESVKKNVRVENAELMIHKSLLGNSNSFSYKDDFYCTGDIIEWINEKNGLFKFVSRKNELINVGGYKVNPEEVESAISEISGVLQSIVYGKPNSILGNILCAEIKLIPNNNLTEFDIRHFLSSKIQDFKIPRKIKFVDTFSLTRTGKIKRL